MAGMSAALPRVSFADLETWPDDGRRYELYDGEVFVVPSPLPLHQSVLARLHLAFEDYLKAHGGLAAAAVAPPPAGRPHSRNLTQPHGLPTSSRPVHHRVDTERDRGPEHQRLDERVPAHAVPPPTRRQSPVTRRLLPRLSVSAGAAGGPIRSPPGANADPSTRGPAPTGVRSGLVVRIFDPAPRDDEMPAFRGRTEEPPVLTSGAVRENGNAVAPRQRVHATSWRPMPRDRQSDATYSSFMNNCARSFGAG